MTRLALAVAACWLLPAVAGAADADHLLLTEVVIDVRTVPLIGSKFVEIFNPTDSEVDLTDVYLTNGTQQPSIFYYNIVTGADLGGGAGQKWHARFPAGAIIAPGDTIVIDIPSVSDRGQYEEAYRRLPDFELFEDGTWPDQVPELVEVFPGSIGAGLGTSNPNVPDLNKTTGSLVLYRWDGQSDLVQDIDYFIWGSQTPVRVDKTGVEIDGPDPDQEPSAYQDDTPIRDQDDDISIPSFTFGRSLMRDSADEGAETLSGGNGLTGHDETSEDFSATWTLTGQGGQDPATQPATWFPPAPIVTRAVQDPLIPGPEDPIVIEASVAAFDSVVGLTVHYSFDGVDFREVAGRSDNGQQWRATIPPQAVDAVVSWYLTAAGLGGGQVTYPVAAPAFVRSFKVIDPLKLVVPARTFLPLLGEEFPIDFVFRIGSETYLRIFDLEGREVITLFDSRFNIPDPPDAPFPESDVELTATWDGRDSRFELVPAGLYIIQLHVVDRTTGEQTQKTAPVVVATRLSR